MPVRVQVGGRTVEFPDGTSEAEMRAALDSLPSEPAVSHEAGVPRGELGTGNMRDRQSFKELEAAGYGSLLSGAETGGIVSGAPTAVGQAVQQFAPNVSRLLSSGAERMYGGLLKAKDATLERFPNVVKDLIAARVPITQGGRGQVISRLKSIGSEKNSLLAAADERAMVPRSVLRSGLDDTLENVIENSDAPVKDMGKLAKIERDLIPDEPGVLPSRADRIKTKLQSESDRAYRGMKMGTRVNDTTAQAKTGIARQAKEAVEAIEPRMRGVNASYGSNKGQAQALRETLKRTDKTGVIGMNDLIGGTLGMAGGPMGIPAGVATMRLLTNPNVGSRTALNMDRASKIPQLDQLTRAVMLAILSEQQPNDQ